VDAIRKLQNEMAEGAQLQLLEPTVPWVNAEEWNVHLQEIIDKGDGWHDAPWWIVENYMYKRLLQELGRVGGEAASYDPFRPQKLQSMQAASKAYDSTVRPVLVQIDAA